VGGRVATAGKAPRRGRHPYERLQSFFTEQIWGAPGAGVRRGQAFLYRLSRIAYSSVRGFFDNRLTVRAAALTYFSVLSIVPFLAFAFAILKGFGAYSSFIEGTVRPYLQQTFTGNEALLESSNRILHFVERTDVSKLGTFGLLFLVYTSLSLISSVEQALNEIWGAKTTRPVLRQVTDYVTLLVTTPLLILVATTFATAAQSSDAVRFLRHSVGLGPVIDFLLRFTSVLVVGVALFAIYTILPNVHTRPRSALFGAAVAAVLWQGALVLHVQFQMGVAKYNALYSVMSALPIFLVWTYVSWLIVLVGAQVAASHQNEQVTRQRLYAQRADQALKETLAVAAPQPRGSRRAPRRAAARDGGDPGGPRPCRAPRADRERPRDQLPPRSRSGHDPSEGPARRAPQGEAGGCPPRRHRAADRAEAPPRLRRRGGARPCLAPEPHGT